MVVNGVELNVIHMVVNDVSAFERNVIHIWAESYKTEVLFFQWFLQQSVKGRYWKCDS